MLDRLCKQKNITDFFLLGGSSLIILPWLFMLFPPEEPHFDQLAVLLFKIAILLDFTINFPHFAYSYLIFYRNFPSKLGGHVDALLRPRFWIAGVFIPAALAIVLAVGAVNHDLTLLGYLVNLRLFTLGWHYAKQGLGVFSLLNRERGLQIGRFERTLFHGNTHLAWIAIWAHFNRESAPSRYIGIPFSSFELPDLFVNTVVVLAGVAFAGTISAVLRRISRNPEIAFSLNSLLAYFSAAYLWIFFRLSLGESRGTALAYLFAPLFHSLQYYAITHRLERNRGGQILKFVASGLILGAIGFFLGPLLLNRLFPQLSSDLNANFFKFAFWTFINIHHFFIDNVSWRRESESVQEFLVERRRS